ncbi:MAG: tRNA 2-thiouridine(34) synthase MnmA [Nanoarchaeota archaeon]|nr:tRNA 2-thiouridine(34) synthase MnmA [Nanoarchaeota archaeon]
MVKGKRVVVAMSGGVDSSVAAYLMKERGFDVVGVFLKCWSDSKNSTGECNWRSERRHALRVASKLGISLVTVDAEKEYRKYVVDVMFKDYKRGITPNPDILCNEIVKFPFLLNEAKRLKADMVVTGHFVRIKKGLGGRTYLLRGKDEMKDQSYFLYRLKEKDLEKLMFPIGEYTKAEVRKIALAQGFINHDKKSTVGICFIGKMDMKEFLKSKIKPKSGKILGVDGEVLGEHDGVYYYTIGQRLGERFDLVIKKKGSSQMGRWYVSSKDVKKNTLTVAPAWHEDLYKNRLRVIDFHLINGGLEKFKRRASGLLGVRVKSRIRHVGELVPSILRYNKKTKGFELKLSRGLTGVSAGQAVVFYKGKRVIGGGVIRDF